MIVDPAQPLTPQKMMRARPMRHRPSQPLTVRASRADRIEPTSTKPPRRDAAHIELGPLPHILQHAGPQPIRRGRVSRVSGTIGRAGDLADNHRPAAVDDLVRALAVVGPVAVQPGHEQDDGDAVRRAGFLGNPDVQRDVGAVEACAVRVRHEHLAQLRLPERRRFQVQRLLSLEYGALHGVGGPRVRADIGEACDPQHYRCAPV